MPRRIPLAVLLSRLTAGLNTAVNTTWNGTTILPVARGSARAKFLGTSSPIIIDRRVAIVIAMIVDTTATTGSGRKPANTGERNELNAGSRVYPASRVVRVIPSCALERCVDVFLSAEITTPRPRSPRDSRTSRSDRSRFTRANSDATKNPVPIVSRMPTPSRISSFMRNQREGVYWEGRPLFDQVYR